MIKLSTSRNLKETKQRNYRVHIEIIGKTKEYNYYFNDLENAILKAKQEKQFAKDFNKNYIITIYNQNTYEEIEW